MSKHATIETRSALQCAFKTLRSNYVAVAAFSFFINILLFVGPLYMLQVYDRVLTSRSEVTLALISVLALGMLAVYGILESVRSRILVRTGARFDEILAERLFRNSFRGHVRSPQGAYGQALRDLDTVRDAMSGGAIIAFFDAPWVPVFLAICFLLHPYLGLVALTGALIIFGLALANELMTRKTLNQASNATRSANNYVTSTLRNAETVHALGMSPGILARWKRLHLEALGYQGLASDRAGTILAMSKFTRMALQIAVLGVGAWLVLDVQITPGVMIATSIMMGRALAPVESAVGQWKSIVASRAAYGRLREAFASGASETENMQLPAPLGAVKLEQVVVVPPGSRLPTLRGVSLEIAAGEVVGVVGPSGAGKSTLARALVGIWPTASGQVRIDGSDILTWDPDDLGPYMGYLPQDVELFAGSVADNIARFGTVDPAAVVHAARLAGVHDVILKLPDGYDTLIGESGRALSGGQRQRIALARALYGGARLIVLDEPNASLDSEGERALSEAIANAKKDGRTVVVISHRTSLLSVVDKLAVFSGGTLTLYGPRDAVLNQLNKSPNTLTQPRGQVTPLKLG